MLCCRLTSEKVVEPAEEPTSNGAEPAKTEKLTETVGQEGSGAPPAAPVSSPIGEGDHDPGELPADIAKMHEEMDRLVEDASAFLKEAEKDIAAADSNAWDRHMSYKETQKTDIRVALLRQQKLVRIATLRAGPRNYLFSGLGGPGAIRGEQFSLMLPTAQRDLLSSLRFLFGEDNRVHPLAASSSWSAASAWTDPRLNRVKSAVVCRFLRNVDAYAS